MWKVRVLGVKYIAYLAISCGFLTAPAAYSIPVREQQQSDLSRLQALPDVPIPSASSSPAASGGTPEPVPSTADAGTNLPSFGRLSPGPVSAIPLPGLPSPGLPKVAGAPLDPLHIPNPPHVAGGPAGIGGAASDAPSVLPEDTTHYAHANGVLTLHNAVQVVRFSDPKIPGVSCYLVGPALSDTELSRARLGGNIAPVMSISCIAHPGATVPDTLAEVETVEDLSSDSFVVDRIWEAGDRSLLYVVLDLNKGPGGVPLATSTALSLGDARTVPSSVFTP